MIYEERQEGEVHVWKTTLAGNGGLYGWKEIDEEGNEVRTSEQTYASEADAEKAIRTLAPSSDIVEVMNVKNINPEANLNVNLVRPAAVRDQFAGMNLVSKSVEDKAVEEAAAEAASAASERVGSSKSEKEKKTPEIVVKISGAELSKAIKEQGELEEGSKFVPSPLAKPAVAVEHPNVAKMVGMAGYSKDVEAGPEKKLKGKKSK